MDAIEPFILRNCLLFFLLPAWVATGAVDWWCDRRTGIERFGLYEPLHCENSSGEIALPSVKVALAAWNFWLRSELRSIGHS